MCPGDSAAGGNGDSNWIESRTARCITDRHGRGRRSAGGYDDLSAHRVQATHVIDRPDSGKRKRKRAAGIQCATVKCCRGARTAEPMQEDWYLIIGFVPLRISHHDPAKQSAIHVVADHLVMIVERPASDGLVRGFEFIDPSIAGADFIRPSAHPASDAKRP